MIDFYSYQLFYVSAFGIASLVLLVRRRWMFTVRIMALVECIMLSQFLAYNGYLHNSVPYTIPAQQPNYDVCIAMMMANWGVRYLVPAFVVVVIGLTAPCNAWLNERGEKTCDWWVVGVVTLIVGAVYLAFLTSVILVSYAGSSRTHESCQTPLEPAVHIILGVFFVFLVGAVAVCLVAENAYPKRMEEWKEEVLERMEERKQEALKRMEERKQEASKRREKEVEQII